MAGESETLEESVEIKGSLLGECNGKDIKVEDLGSDLCLDGVCTHGSDAEQNEEDKDVNPTGGQGSVVVRSLEGKSEKETAELDGVDATLKTLDEHKNIDHEEGNKMLEKEAISDFIQVESDIRQSIEEAGISEQVGSHVEQEIKDEEFNDAQNKINGKAIKRVSVKSSGKVYQTSYQLPTKKEDEFCVHDLVWGKVKSHPWWPGQIFDPSDSSAQARKHFKKDCYLVAYFGDGTFAWNEASQLKPFRTHFSNIQTHCNSEAFRNAVDCALEEVTRRVEFGLACSCTPKDIYDKNKLQIVENSGIQQELSFINRVDESLNVSSFSPKKLMEYLKTLSKMPTGGFDQLELLIAKAQLLAYYRLKGYSYLPEIQYRGGLDNDWDTSINATDKKPSAVNEHATHVSKNDDQTGTENLKTSNDTRHKHKHVLKDGVYPQNKKKRLSKPAHGTPDSTHDDDWSDEVNDKLISLALSKKRKTIDHYADVSQMKDRRKTISLAKVSNSTKQSFKIGDCIRRVASQLTGSPSVMKCSGDRSQMADVSAIGFSGNGSDILSNLEESQKPSLTFPTEYSSLDDLLSLLQWVAQEPQGDYGFLNVIVSFFSDFRNSIIVVPVGETPETLEFDELSETYSTDMVIQNGSEKQQSQRSSRQDLQPAPVDSEKPVQVSPTIKTYFRRRYSDRNHAKVTENPSGYIDEKSPAELVLNFADLDSVPSETSLNKIFRHFGPLKESETEIDRGGSRARVVFKRCADAEAAFSSAKKINLFGQILVNYQLNYTLSTLFKVSSFATTKEL